MWAGHVCREESRGRGQAPLRAFFSRQADPRADPLQNRFYGHEVLILSPHEALAGCERTIHIRTGTSLTSLLLKIPPGIEDGQTMRLVMGEQPRMEVLFRVQVR